MEGFLSQVENLNKMESFLSYDTLDFLIKDLEENLEVLEQEGYRTRSSTSLEEAFEAYLDGETTSRRFFLHLAQLEADYEYILSSLETKNQVILERPSMESESVLAWYRKALEDCVSGLSGFREGLEVEGMEQCESSLETYHRAQRRLVCVEDLITSILEEMERE